MGSTVHKAGELAPNVRQAVESLLGRRLRADEHVSVIAYAPHAAPTGEERVELAKRVEEGMNRLSAKLDKVPEGELDRLLDEAVDHTRHHRS